MADVALLTSLSEDDVKCDPVWEIELFGSWRYFVDDSSGHIEDLYCDPANDGLRASIMVNSRLPSLQCFMLLNRFTAKKASLNVST